MTEKNQILLIDDSSVNNLLMQNILEDQGYEVATAFSGKEGLDKLQVIKPDLIILDIMMPRMDGFEVLRKILSNPDTENIPVIMLTAKKDSEDEKLAREIGALDYMTKPVDIKFTLERIKRVFHSY
jgi:DNA-binding response OmpR family regulator